MRSTLVTAALFATPAFSHPATLPHSHTDWSLPIGLCLIGVAAVVAALRARVRVRK